MDLDDGHDAGPKADLPAGQPRTRARLAAVQALYQMEMTQRDLSLVLQEFLGRRFETVEIYAGADRSFFRDIVEGIARGQAKIDLEIAAHLASNWKLSRIDSILRAILRSGVYELTDRNDVPARAVINEYVEIAKDFFGGEEPGVVNGVLDRVARAKRSREFGRKSGGKGGPTKAATRFGDDTSEN
ncbi:transcription antitermination factor NusB [Rhodomicrobium vannielii ATCC 17100]|uniref:transcription antitermination factor NusB n=1 Tax=Rhodomicrobium vannielii TaxID=1069 RepID=UPI00191AF725|nr:transcription antitermination factor NusB [Rhodomicrobium vannielii]MBJ7533192.1 transcription antitermination factor NusB [Rhodomicrobium vannielii ATCC 17100]